LGNYFGFFLLCWDAHLQECRGRGRFNLRMIIAEIEVGTGGLVPLVHALLDGGRGHEGAVVGQVVVLALVSQATEPFRGTLLGDELEQLLSIGELNLGGDILVQEGLDQFPKTVEDPGGVEEDEDTEPLRVKPLKSGGEELHKGEVHVLGAKRGDVKEEGEGFVAGGQQPDAVLHLVDGELPQAVLVKFALVVVRDVNNAYRPAQDVGVLIEVEDLGIENRLIEVGLLNGVCPKLQPPLHAIEQHISGLIRIELPGPAEAQDSGFF